MGIFKDFYGVDPLKTYDYIVIGSGFGGSVSAMRLAEKGYNVLLLEEGKWRDDQDFPKTNNNAFRFFWFPKIFCRGYQRIDFFKHLAVLGGCGVGGGSIIYANSLLVPEDKVFSTNGFPKGTDWNKELKPFYKTASRMLGKTENTVRTGMDDLLKEAADQRGRGDTFHYVDIGVYFGEPEVTVPDPYFKGKGPDRTGCTQCAGCMVGCRIGAKNSLAKNYLYFAQKFGAAIEPEMRVDDVIRDGDEWIVSARRSTALLSLKKYQFKARNVIVSAGVIGSLKLLFNLKRKNRLKISNRLGWSVRSNSESLIGARQPGRGVNLAEGVAITSAIYLDDSTHIQVVRYPKGSNAMSLISTFLTEKKKGIYRPLSMLANTLIHPIKTFKVLNPIGWAKQTVILLVMQTEDNRIKMIGKKKLFGGMKLKSRLEEGKKKVPVYIPQANEFAKEMASRMGGIPLSCVYEVFFDTPLTAHILGGCVLGSEAGEGVINSEHKLFGYDNFYVIDASAIPANLGVNPALTISAMAERAIDKINFKDGKKRERIGFE
jgi:cholesterol oxidase